MRDPVAEADGRKCVYFMYANILKGIVNEKVNAKYMKVLSNNNKDGDSKRWDRCLQLLEECKKLNVPNTDHAHIGFVYVQLLAAALAFRRNRATATLLEEFAVTGIRSESVYRSALGNIAKGVEDKNPKKFFTQDTNFPYNAKFYDIWDAKQKLSLAHLDLAKLVKDQEQEQEQEQSTKLEIETLVNEHEHVQDGTTFFTPEEAFGYINNIVTSVNVSVEEGSLKMYDLISIYNAAIVAAGKVVERSPHDFEKDAEMCADIISMFARCEEFGIKLNSAALRSLVAALGKAGMRQDVILVIQAFSESDTKLKDRGAKRMKATNTVNNVVYNAALNALSTPSLEDDNFPSGYDYTLVDVAEQYHDDMVARGYKLDHFTYSASLKILRRAREGKVIERSAKRSEAKRATTNYIRFAHSPPPCSIKNVPRFARRRRPT